MHHKKAPVNLNLLSIRLPVTAFVSILHRVTGLLLFVSLPFVLLLFESILTDTATTQHSGFLLSQWYMRWLFLIALWSLAHHLFAGIRFLLLDIDIGVMRSTARQTAWVILVLDVLFMLLLGVWVI